MLKSYWRKDREESQDDDDLFYLPLEGDIEREYGLADEFEEDFWNVFADLAHYAVLMTFEIRQGADPYRFRTKVVWDTETLKNRLVVQQQGVYMGTVLCFILKRLFRVQPKPEDIIWEIVHRRRREVKQPWRVLDVVDSELVYELSLDKIVAN